MNKKTYIIIATTILSIILISGIVMLTVTRADSASALESIMNDNFEVTDEDDTYIPSTGEDQDSSPTLVIIDEEETFVPATAMDLEPTSITVFVNKEYALPKDYRPEQMVVPDIYFNLIYYDDRTLLRPEAAVAIEKLFNAAKDAGYHLCGISGFRSYERQKKIFKDNIVKKGKEHTLKYSAVPGTSEHQTGLAIDISSETLNFALSSTFADTLEGKWLADNAYRFGYIIRYPQGKASITGYAYEPWHIRYVGSGLAKYLYENDLTLEEYYNYTPSPDFDFEALYADLINYTLPTVITGIPVDGDGVIIGENGEIIDGELATDIDPNEGEAVPTQSPDSVTKVPTPKPIPSVTPIATPTGIPDSEDDPTDITGIPDGGSGEATVTPGNETNPSNTPNPTPVGSNPDLP